MEQKARGKCALRTGDGGKAREKHMDLLDLRMALDEIDARIVELYERRMEICARVAEHTIDTG